jgi:hypothetical protein
MSQYGHARLFADKLITGKRESEADIMMKQVSEPVPLLSKLMIQSMVVDVHHSKEYHTDFPVDQDRYDPLKNHSFEKGVQKEILPFYSLNISKIFGFPVNYYTTLTTKDEKIAFYEERSPINFLDIELKKELMTLGLLPVSNTGFRHCIIQKSDHTEFYLCIPSINIAPNTNSAEPAFNKDYNGLANFASYIYLSEFATAEQINQAWGKDLGYPIEVLAKNRWPQIQARIQKALSEGTIDAEQSRSAVVLALVRGEKPDRINILEQKTAISL